MYTSYPFLKSMIVPGKVSCDAAERRQNIVVKQVMREWEALVVFMVKDVYFHPTLY